MSARLFRGPDLVSRTGLNGLLFSLVGVGYTTGGFQTEEAADPVRSEAPTMTTTRVTVESSHISTLKISDPLTGSGTADVPNFKIRLRAGRYLNATKPSLQNMVLGPSLTHLVR